MQCAKLESGLDGLNVEVAVRLVPFSESLVGCFMLFCCSYGLLGKKDLVLASPFVLVGGGGGFERNTSVCLADLGFSSSLSTLAEVNIKLRSLNSCSLCESWQKG